MPDLTGVFLTLLEDPLSCTMDSPAMASLERMFVVCYSKSCSAPTLDEAHRQLFTTGTRTLDTLPPTTAAFYQHIHRSILQASFFWTQCLVPMQVIPDYAEWGWKLSENMKQWVTFWTIRKDASEACLFLTKCGCKKSCRGNCKCFKSAIQCSSLCSCRGGCTNNGDD